MDAKFLPKRFFQNNPLDERSSAYLSYFIITNMFGNDELQDAIFDIAKEGISPQRLEKIEREKHEIDQLGAGDEFVRYIRSGYDVVNRERIVKRALTMQETVIPALLHRYRTSMQDEFVETTVYVLSHAEPNYVDQVKAMYAKLRNPYAQSLSCLLFGMTKRTDMIPLLLAEYERLKREFPNESLCQGPLLAIYILYGKA